MTLPSLWSAWDPTRPESLRPRPNDKRQILPEDLVRILEGSPECVPDPLLRDMLIQALRGELRRKRGRPSSRLSNVELTVADLWIDLAAEEIRAERARRHQAHLRGELEPRMEAANRVAHRFGNITGKHLLTMISEMKNRRNFSGGDTPSA